MTAYDLTGRRFGRLVAIRIVGKSKGGTAMWECQCDCGNTHITKSSSLLSGDTKSCGCLHREQLRERKTIHGLKHTRLYSVWNKMKQRCHNENDKSYKNYGGRGIKVCSEWRYDFQSFYDWALANGYQEGLTIDRKNNDGDYEPGNCRWATDAEQNLNKRTNRFITFEGETKTVKEFADKYGIRYTTLYSRLWRGESEGDSLFRKPDARYSLEGRHEGKEDKGTSNPS